VRVGFPGGKSTIRFVVDVEDTKVRLADPEHENGRAVLRGYVTPIDVAALR
jgi:hypothetical protein